MKNRGKRDLERNSSYLMDEVKSLVRCIEDSINEDLDKDFTELLWSMPVHFFASSYLGIKRQPPISIATRQTLYVRYGHEKIYTDVLVRIYEREKLKWLMKMAQERLSFPLYIY